MSNVKLPSYFNVQNISLIPQQDGWTYLHYAATRVNNNPSEMESRIKIGNLMHEPTKVTQRCI